jgi:hypothetical protein
MAQQALDILSQRSKIRPFSGDGTDAPSGNERSPGFMTTSQPPQPSARTIREKCKHPRVQIVARDEDAEYVECKECGDVFESSEFKDMELEEAKAPEDDL